jgi:hypothetical protein
MVSSGLVKCSACDTFVHTKAKNPDKIFFRYPRTPERKREWIKRLKVDELSLGEHSKVCDSHFKRNQFVRYRLIRKALPFTHDLEDKENHSTKRYVIVFED